MADEDESQKTEEPTAKKLQDAKEKGEVASSQELKTWFMLAAATAVVAGLGPFMASSVALRLQVFMGNIHLMDTEQVGATANIFALVREVFFIIIIPFSIFVVIALAASYIQHGATFTFEKLKPDLSKLSPLKGAKKIFSTRIFIEFVKITLKLIGVTSAVLIVVLPERELIDTIMYLSVIDLMGLIYTMAVRLMIAVLIFLTIVAAIDYSYQKYQYIKKLRMTKQEVKDERKQSDGDPHVKGRLRSIRRERAMQRMMANIPKADVVITNPTHYAVALEYKHGTMDVPKLVAKGVDTVALRIREMAEEHGVPIIENPPLARALHAGVDIDEEIPPEHYKAVAGVISYIMKLRKAGFSGRKR
ncbi:flagellar biosynthesis protein FlhB [Kordiimonas aestuarii]|uniref:flagellar biosynthesis protein FlhB n=1 Tax=Kordiimonas aestuarii TaxID=1005925 RepID=UPI0021D271D9|nr:flagellar biosynthesis protein FlhB [Kordiimonas aestuarii]